MGQRITRPLTEADLDARAEAMGLNAAVDLGLPAWFSRAAAQAYGTVWWGTADGKEVEVTAVGVDADKYLWPDKVLVGYVTHWVRGGLAEYLGMTPRSACTHRCHQGRACTCEPPQPIARPIIVPDEMACTAGTDNDPPRRGLLGEFWAFITARSPYLKR